MTCCFGPFGVTPFIHHQFNMSTFGRSYPAAAATGTPAKVTPSITFLYSEELPSATSSTTKTRQVQVSMTTKNQQHYVTTSKAQNQFDHHDETLVKALDTSVEISEYVVTEADGKNVRFRHRNNVQKVFVIYTLFISDLLYPIKRFIDLKNEVKKLRHEVRDLQKENEDTKRIFTHWQVVSALLEGN